MYDEKADFSFIPNFSGNLVYLYVYNALLLILSSQSISKLQYFLYNSIYGNRVIPLSSISCAYLVLGPFKFAETLRTKWLCICARSFLSFALSTNAVTSQK